LSQPENTELYLVYDPKISKMHTLSLLIRLKKIVGLTSIIEIGPLVQYENNITEIIRMDRKVQVFGNLYQWKK